MSAPASDIKLAITNSLPIIKVSISNLIELATPPTVATEEEISYRSHLEKTLALYSKTGQPAALNGTIIIGTVNPLIAVVAEKQAAHNAAKTNDDFASTLVELVAAQEAVVAYYTGILQAI